MECAIVGFDFTNDSLLSGSVLELRPGLTVAYGANGAGKTRLLRGMNAALSGVQSDVSIALIVRAQRPSDLTGVRHYWSGDGSGVRPFLVALAQALPYEDKVAWYDPGRTLE